MFFYIFIILILIIILFILLNNKLNNKLEHYERIGNPLYGEILPEEEDKCYSCKKKNNNFLCGNIGDKCTISEDEISTCCNGYSCKRQTGNYNYKICMDKGNSDSDSDTSNCIIYNSGLKANIDYPHSNSNNNSDNICNSSDFSLNLGFLSDTVFKDRICGSK